MKTVGKILRALDGLYEKYGDAIFGEGAFVRICLRNGISPVDAEEILYDETGYDWRNLNFLLGLLSDTQKH